MIRQLSLCFLSPVLSRVLRKDQPRLAAPGSSVALKADIAVPAGAIDGGNGANLIDMAAVKSRDGNAATCP